MRPHRDPLQYRAVIAATFEGNPKGVKKSDVALAIKSALPADGADMPDNTYTTLMKEFGVYDKGAPLALPSCGCCVAVS